VYTGFWWGNLRKRDSLKDPGVGGSIVFILILRKWDGLMEWIDLAQNRALANAVVNLFVP
jgi:hypothetical protein